MSTLKADTIQSTGGGAATLTKQQTAKHWVNYDAINQTVNGSLNQTSFNDHATGEFTSNFTSNFSSAEDRCQFASALNSTNGGVARLSGEERCGVTANMGHLANDTHMSAPTTGHIDFFTGIGSSSSSNGQERDLSASYCMTIGDLA